ncbi:MAG: lysylphosphatidylglycerol synthase transmembrane domain-containing protein [Ilumatobacteraceae bacterium]
MTDAQPGAAAPDLPRRRLPHVGSWLGVAGAGIVLAFVVALVVGNRADFPVAWDALRTANLGWLAVAAITMIASLVNLGMFHAAAQRAAGLDTPRLALVGAATSANFLNLVTKSGGLAGLAALNADAKLHDRRRSAVLAAYLLVVLMGEWTFAATLLATLVIMQAGGHLFAAEIAASAVFAVVVIAKIVVTVAAWRSPAMLRRITSATARLKAKITRNRHGATRSLPSVDQAEEFAEVLSIIRSRPLRCLPVAGHAFAVELFGVVELFAVVAAVGEGHSVSVALVAYSISVLFAIVGFLPGGLGFVEVSLTAALVTFGVAGGPAAAAVVLYRVVELWLPAAIGGPLTLRLRRSGRIPA